ncbi:MAG: hypothetical protein H7276_13710, partial [Caulobacter sp.]|nr:hypothetical protein [Vitreoscilla sp.]
MTLHRVLSLGLAASLAVAACPPATAQRDAAMDAVLAARAPLAVSGDGAWRLSVDSHDVLHRAGLADPSRESTTQLPPGVQALATSADGRRVALASTGQCIGRVDFDATGDATSAAWRAASGWAASMPADCGTRAPAPPVAISSDGPWIAAPDAVVDAATGQVVASLPFDAARVLRLQFVDHDARLLVARVPRPDRLSLSVWDLASKALVDDVETRASPALRLDVSAQTGAVFRVDRAASSNANANVNDSGDSGAPLELVRFAPGTCVAAPRGRARL